MKKAGAKVTVSGSEPPFNTDQLLAFEEEINAALPADYRDFLIAHNGGRLSPNAFNWGDSAYQDSCIDFLLPLSGNRSINLIDFHRLYQKKAKRVPSDLLPIALDPGGNLICIGIRGAHQGKVYFWDHEHEREPGRGEADYQNVRLISPTFTAFLTLLHEPDRSEGDLFYAMAMARQGDDRELRRLIASTYNPDYKLKYLPFTLLEYSVYFQEYLMTELLLQKEGRIELQNAMRLAAERGNQRALLLLQQAAEKQPS